MLGKAFDPNGELLIHEHCRPHWSQAGTVVFITFRTHDSIPVEVVERRELEKREWLRQRGWKTDAHWSKVVPTLPDNDRLSFLKTFNRCREQCLDSNHGRCLLRRPEFAQIVADSLLYFDGDRYRMGDFIVMPNHVHLLAVFSSAESMKEQCVSWLHYSAFRINRVLGEKGKLWQQEPFDHLVRNPERYEYLRRYIFENPEKAGLSSGEYLYRRFDG